MIVLNGDASVLGRNHGAVVQQSDRRIWLGHALGAGDGGGNVSDDLSLALLVHSFRQLAVKLSGNKTPVLWRQVGWTTLALAGGVILLVAAVTMWMSAVPVGRGCGLSSRI